MCECLEVDSVIKSFGDKNILTDVYLNCQPGDRIGIFGWNGSGKSTLFEIIFGTMNSDRSFIRIDGKVQKKQAFRSGQIAYLPQHNFLPPNIRVGEAISLYIHQNEREQILNDKNLAYINYSKAEELSGGELRYLEIKLILFCSAKYILLDEPFSALDYQTRLSVCDDISSIIRRTHKTAILVTHDLSEAISVADRIVVLSARPGRVKSVLSIDFPEGCTRSLDRRNCPEFSNYFNTVWKELKTYES